MLDAPTLITADYRKTALARAVPFSFYQDNGWWLPPDPDPDACRIACRLFPALAQNPELVARARLSTVDHSPIDYATPWWEAQSPAEHAMHRSQSIRARAAALQYVNRKGVLAPMTPHWYQDIDSAYAAWRLEQGLGAYFGWEVGLGKTLGAALTMDAWNVNFALILCPNNAKHDPWLADGAQLCPWMKFLVVGNTPKTRNAALDEAQERMDAGEPTALVCHYQAVPLIEKMGAKTVSGWRRFGQWDLLVSDEAHLYKNRTAQFTSAVRRLKAAGRLNLSGSVMSGKAEDLFVPWQMFQPKVYRSQWADWNDRFLEYVVDDYNQKQIVGPALHRLNDFRSELGRSLVVRLAKDCLPGVPEPHVVERELVMHPEQAKVYRTVADELMAELPDGEILYTTDGAPLRSALRQVTAGVPEAPCIYCGGRGERSTWINECQSLVGGSCPDCDGSGHTGGLLSVKHDAAMEDILAAGDSQCVYFAWHKRAVYELQRRCAAEGVLCGLVCGDVSQAARDREIDLFKRGGYRVLVATIATLSSAANLQNASVVGMLEESDDPVDNEQAVGRVVRQGQSVHASVFIYRVKDSVDDLSVMVNAMSKAELRRLLLGTG